MRFLVERVDFRWAEANAGDQLEIILGSVRMKGVWEGKGWREDRIVLTNDEQTKLQQLLDEIAANHQRT